LVSYIGCNFPQIVVSLLSKKRKEGYTIFFLLCHLVTLPFDLFLKKWATLIGTLYIKLYFFSKKKCNSNWFLKWVVLFLSRNMQLDTSYAFIKKYVTQTVFQISSTLLKKVAMVWDMSSLFLMKSATPNDFWNGLVLNMGCTLMFSKRAVLLFKNV
jgi:hypothetical protein